MAKYDYDIIAIGAGSGGLNIAGFMNKAGFKTLLIDKSDKTIGGDCLNFGCVPSKALIHISRLIHNSNSVAEFGVKTTGKVDIKKVMEYIKSKQEIFRKHESAAWFKSLGMDVALGKAQFAGPNSVKVNNKTYTGKKIVLATGSSPRKLELPGIEKVDYLTNETIFDIDYLPKKFLIIGGGPIGIELGQAFNRLGSEVHILEHGPKFLPKESSEISEVLHKQLEKEGMKFHFNTTPTEFSSSKELIIKNSKGKNETISFDAVLISIGRQINTQGLDLEKADIQMDGRKIKVNEYLQTTNKNVFCCGDIAGSYQFTHAAELHAGVIISNFFSPIKKKLTNDHLSWVTYTNPEIATFGLNEKQLEERNIEYEKLELGFDEDDRAIVDEYTDSKVVLYISKDKLVGGSMVAPGAGELFQELVLTNSAKLDIKHLFNKVYPYPTASRINKKIISTYFSKKLTPKAKKILQFLY